MTLFSFLIPTRRRSSLLDRLFRSILDTTAGAETLEIILGVDDDDEESKAISHPDLTIKKVVLAPGGTMGALNRACFAESSGRYVMLMNDDVILRTKNWDKIIYAAASVYADDVVLIHVNDLLFREKLCTFPLLSRTTCLEIGVCPAEYQRYRIDDHIYNVYSLLAALGHRRIVYLPEVVFEHDHYQMRSQGSPSQIFRSREGKIYVPDQEIVQRDARVFEEKLEERKDAAVRLAHLIERRRYERFLGKQMVVNERLLAEVRDSYAYRGSDFAKPVLFPNQYSEETVRTTIAVVTSDIRKEHAQRCLSSIKANTRNYDLIVLDNSESKNFSHPREMNKILRMAQSDFVVLMDDDVFVEPGWLDGLLRCMDEETAVVVPVYKDINGTIAFSGVYLAGDGQGTHAHTVDKPDSVRAAQCYCGALLLIDMRKCGHILMDETYQKYFFDLVHSLEVWELGFKAVCTPDVVVTHIGGATLTYGSAKSREIWRRDCGIFVKDWIESGRLARIAQGMWQTDPYLKALSDTPRRIQELFDNLGELTLAEFEDEVKKLLAASRGFGLFRHLIMGRVCWCIPALTKKLIGHGVSRGVSWFQTEGTNPGGGSQSAERSEWQRLKFHSLLMSQAVALFAMGPVVGRVLRRLIGARTYSELKRWCNAVVFTRRTGS